MRTWRTFAGVCWTGKRFDFDGGAQEVLGRGRNPPVTALPCQPPLGKGAMRTGVRIATSSVRTGFAMTRFLQGVRYKADSGGQRRPPLRGVTRNLVERGVGDAAPYEWDGGTDCHTSVRTGFAMTHYR